MARTDTAAPPPPTPDSQEIRLGSPLGELAVAKGFITEVQVRACLEAQAELSRQGVQKRLGDLMLERGYLLPHQLDAVLREQERAPTQRRIQHYELLAKLGEGGMGAVLKARRETDGQLVALKVLFKRLAADEQYIQRFHREAAIGLTLDHPNLVRCLEVGESEGLHFMALEYIQGEDLGAILQHRSYFPESQALAIVLAAARGIAHAHAKGLVHRDVKPANIMLTREGQVKVMDFGLARRAVDTDHRLTLTGIVMGTPHYISPEQVESRETVDGRSDVYSLGVTLFHLLAGRPPFVGGNLYEIFNLHVTGRVPDPRTFNSAISAETAELVLWMCAREPERRIASMELVVRKLGQAMGLPSAGQEAPLPTPLAFQFDAPAPKRLASTQAAFAQVREELRCPRCGAAYEGDPLLVLKDQPVRCAGCGLSFASPVASPPPPPIFPDEISLEQEVSVTGALQPARAPAPAPASAPAPATGPEAAGTPDPGDVLVTLEADAPAELPPLEEHPPPQPPSARMRPPLTTDRVVRIALRWLLAAAVLAFAAWLAQALWKGKFDKYF